MADEKNFSLINVGDFSVPANTLIEKISNAIGWVTEPYQVERLAKADAAAAIIKAENEIAVTDIQRRAMTRLVHEETRKQQNIEDITVQAIPYLEEDSDAGDIGNDWVTNFLDHARLISDAEMQSLWARILAGEANNSGTFSKRTVNFLRDLDKTDAELFTKLCCFEFFIDGKMPLIFNTMNDIYVNNGVDFNTINHLENIGLVKFDGTAGFSLIKLPRYMTVNYYNEKIELDMKKEDNNQLDIGSVIFTKVGEELASICNSKPIDGYLDYVKLKWKNYITESEG